MWAEELAKKIIKEHGKKKLFISTMITPSGPIHLGNLKEVMVGFLISDALKKAGAEVSFNFFVDNFDHLRRVYPFLPKSFEKYVGRSLSEIPDFWNCHKSYDKHFLEPFLQALVELNVKPKVRYVDLLYKNGTYTPVIKIALRNRDKIYKIISKISGRVMPKDWSPFMPLCAKCGKINQSKVVGQELDKNLVQYQCLCGHKGKADFSKGQGKLVWRVHWSANWKTFNVSIEGFGKDQATKGGGYDTASAIVKEIYHQEPPFPVPYEWVYVKGQGKMAGSTGIGFTPLQMLEVMPSETLIYFYERTKPNKHFDFDIAEGLPALWNESGGLTRIPFEHLVMVAQSAFSFEDILDSLKRTGYGKQVQSSKSKIQNEIKYVKNWLKDYAPERYKFAVQKSTPKIKLSHIQKEFLSNILKAVEGKKLDGEKLHQEIHNIKNKMKIPPREAFSAIYQIFLGKDSGPQAGWFLAGLDKKFVIKRLKEVIQ